MRSKPGAEQYAVLVERMKPTLLRVDLNRLVRNMPCGLVGKNIAFCQGLRTANFGRIPKKQGRLGPFAEEPPVFVHILGLPRDDIGLRYASGESIV